ncbi:Serine--tRNA ligase, mitochondrial [Hypsibius exemplaris]|uniref:serine--tRNA ligase n=1 Tax=Hypsibius exemplaris TaxID=2072580 RepID=A0A1W0WL75_HYPEX|nr:Serine--tRNA ligase, mitochondrial [Hypsibius exemplaris]
MAAATIELLGIKQALRFTPKSIDQLAAGYNGLRTTKLTKLSTERAYYFSGFLAQLERALLAFTTDFLKLRGFEFVSVPDLISPEILQGCGMAREETGNRNTLVYNLEEKQHGKFALSGTSEMALAALHRNKILPASSLPIRLSAVSRCYRAEVSEINTGIYRVHEFTKVEMFGLCRPELSHALFLDFVSVQRDLVNALGLHAQVLDMPKEDLGLSAHQKYDIEAWMPGTGRYGEISSASNCRDYQSSRLNMRYRESDGATELPEKLPFVHTVNGTACAIPRMIITIMEQCQESNGVITVPEVLRKYLGDAVKAVKPSGPADIYWRKSIKDKTVQDSIARRKQSQVV